MFRGHFYHEKTRKCVAAFGRLFNEIYIVRKSGQLKVPLAYAPREKYLERIRENADLDTDTKVALKLPRMSFEITGISYDLSRQLQKLNTMKSVASADTKRNTLYSGVPYVLTFQLNVYTKSQDDALQVVEQILPTFNPNYTLTMKPLTEYPDYKEDIPIAITGVGFQDDFQGAVAERRTIIYSMAFEMRMTYHGFIPESSVIREANARVFQIDAGGNDSDLRLETIQVNPDPLTTIGLADSDFGFSTTIFDADSDYR